MHPKNRLPATWAMFVNVAVADDPEVQCVVCRRVTWLAWREGFCVDHQRRSNPHTVDYLSNGDEIRRAEEEFRL